MSDSKESKLELVMQLPHGAQRILKKSASPSIAVENCLNCGECIRQCPTGAIFELQRQICRLCPDCAEGSIMFPRDMEQLTARSCRKACPIGQYPEGYLNLIAGGDWKGAWEVISEINPLPGVLGRICSRPCEEECKRGILIDKPMHIRASKRAVADWAFENGMAEKKVYKRNIDKRVAVVGGGPAGVTAAADLAALGYKVTIFEKSGSLGGMVRRAVPTFRLPDEVWKREFEMVLGDGIDVEYGVSVGKSPSFQNLFDDGFKAIILAVGAPNGKRLNIPGKDYKGVYDALTYMNNVKYGVPVEVGEKTVVIGGGSVATDVARTALRKGSKQVTMVCVETDGSIQALHWELEEAMAEGVSVMTGYAPQKINSTWMRAESLTFAKVRCISSDASGQISCEIDESQTMELAADTVIFAVGQAIDNTLIDQIGLERNEKGGIVMNGDTLETSMPGVFAAGDVTSGPCSVVEAMASARKAARSLDAYLMGKGMEDERNKLESAPVSEKIYPVQLEKLIPLRLPELSADEALTTFDEAQLSPGRDSLQTDARRCMKCGRIEIDHEICVGCGTCRRVCPAGNVITMGKPISGGEEK